MPDAFYEIDGEHARALPASRGPWGPNAQHGGPPAALLGRALERCEPRDGFRLTRVAFDILRPVPMDDLEIDARVVRPGRGVDLLDATLSHDGTVVMRAAAWRFQTADGRSSPAGLHESPPPLRDEDEPSEFWVADQGLDGYWSAIEHRFAEGSFVEPGPGIAWLRMRIPLVDGEEPTPLQRVLIAADSGNGVSAVANFDTHIFINTDLVVNLVRDAMGEWVCLDAVTRISADGVGQTETTLWDERGRIGTARQALVIRPR